MALCKHPAAPRKTLAADLNMADGPFLVLWINSWAILLLGLLILPLSCFWEKPPMKFLLPIGRLQNKTMKLQNLSIALKNMLSQIFPRNFLGIIPSLLPEMW